MFRRFHDVMNFRPPLDTPVARIRSKLSQVVAFQLPENSRSHSWFSDKGEGLSMGTTWGRRRRRPSDLVHPVPPPAGYLGGSLAEIAHAGRRPPKPRRLRLPAARVWRPGLARPRHSATL